MYAHVDDSTSASSSWYNYEIANPPHSRSLKRTFLTDRYALQTVAAGLLRSERVAKCLRKPVPMKNTIELLHSPRFSHGHYGGLAVCGSVWHCPVCSAKIAARRVEELTTAIAKWQGGIVMMTFTIQHSQNESCKYVLSGLLDAHQTFWRGKPADRFKERYGIKAKIRSLEITFGENGWHAHLHSLLFLKATGYIFIGEMQERAAARWQSVLQRFGHFATIKHGIDVRSANDFVAEYVAKFGRPPRRWTEAHELSHSHRKVSRSANGLTPMGLLREAAYGDSRAGQRWVEYAMAFKGKRQLQWSKGLKAQLGVEEKTDEELVTEQEEMAVTLARLDRNHWAAVLANDIRAELLEVASHGQEAVKAFLDGFGIEGVEYPGLVEKHLMLNPVIDVVEVESV